MIGWYLILTERTGERWCLARVVEQLTARLFLVRSCDPGTGEPDACGFYVVDAKALAGECDDGDRRGRLFETYLALREFVGEPAAIDAGTKH